ncbi:MAG: hypothetical protein WDZ28_05510 [Simkaniaceae bacterium]
MKKSHFFSIERTLPQGTPVDKSLDQYYASIENILNEVAKKNGLHEFDNKEDAFAFFNHKLPLFDWSVPNSVPGYVTISALTTTTYSHGLGRFLTDICSKSIIPGRLLPVAVLRCLNFKFVHIEKKRYFITELIIEPKNEEELALFKKHLPKLMSDLRVNLRSVEYTRQIVSSNSISTDEKHQKLKINFANLFCNHDDLSQNDLFGQIYNLYLSASAEEKAVQLPNQLKPYTEKRPRVFRPDLFSEFRSLINSVPPNFLGERSLKHTTRIFTYFYILKAVITHLIKEAPDTRHLYIKIFQPQVVTSNGKQSVLAIALSFNILQHNEFFDDRHICLAIAAIIPGIEVLKGSFFYQENSSDKIQTVYIEIKKDKYKRFTLDEIKQIKRALPREVHTRVEEVYRPIFTYRNEEEIMRRIIELSNELKYVHDIPQVTINYQKQSRNEIFFSVTVLRLQKPDSLPLRDILSSFKDPVAKIKNFDIKTVGLLRRKYPKVAASFDVRLPTELFTRKDYTIDFFKGRKKVLTILEQMLGEVRDYNGGMIAKQREVLSLTKELLKEKYLQNECLIENFFHGLTPIYMQSIFPPEIIKKFFILFNKSLELDYRDVPFSLMVERDHPYSMYMIASPNPKIKEEILKAVEELPFFSDIATSSHNFYDISTIGFLITAPNPATIKELDKVIYIVLSDKKKKKVDRSDHLREAAMLSQISI